MNNGQIGYFKNLLGEENVFPDEMMSGHTSFRIGGRADLFLTPRTAEQIRGIRLFCGKEGIPLFIMGNGSNLLISDAGFRGVIVSIGRNFSGITVEGERMHVQSGASLSSIASEAARASLTGFEFAGGIPGTFGGAAVMNAGAYGGELKDVLEKGLVLTQDGEVKELSVQEMELSYRSSIIGRKKYIVLGGTLRLRKGDDGEIREKMKELSEKRREKQPLEYPSAGSTFKRPEGYFAGKLIMDAGLRGYRVGDAQVSEKHCGFVINRGNATASDVVRLMEDVVRIVRAQSGITLEPEVRFLGEF